MPQNSAAFSYTKREELSNVLKPTAHHFHISRWWLAGWAPQNGYEIPLRVRYDAICVTDHYNFRRKVLRLRPTST